MKTMNKKMENKEKKSGIQSNIEKYYVNEGEFIIIPKGVKHRPIADIETHLLLFEPETILNTGDVRNELALESPKSM
ncbi:MAG: hypothetical protein MUO72_00925 [Bacteroidales bacterium]|nr:hypothetical protein [Bacteroidales bacterium]